ncbi:helix-hairpin-helix domain-containing protein [Streptomyces sp. NPDC005808]|uniref:helix-hairpin-helix domain-containing protein n=1 Tax=Streptomyces sp. NPDC005808 TaxID=3364734 RepID=UPI003691525F
MRAEALFAERAGERREFGNGHGHGHGHGIRPPGAGDWDVGDSPRARTAVGVGVADVWGIQRRGGGGLDRGEGEPGPGVRGVGGEGGLRRRRAVDPGGLQGSGAEDRESSRVRWAVDRDASGDGVAVDAGVRGDVGPGGVAGAWRDRVGPAVRERMPLWLQSRCGLERRSVIALTALLVVAAVFAVQHFWAGRTQPVRAPEVVRAAAPFGETAGQQQELAPGASVGTSSPVGAAGTVIVVDVSGKVRSPGLQRLPAGSRVEDALRAAGGVRPGTNTEGLNRARLLVDGEQVAVGVPALAGGPGSGAAGSVASGGGGVPAAPVSLSTATVEQLDGLPGVGPVLAQHIVDYRTQNGGFRSVDELREVNGIGDRRFADLRNLVRP